MKENIRRKNEAACGAGNTTSGMEDQVVGTANHSKNYDITLLRRWQRPIGDIERFLILRGAIGERNATPSRKISDALGYATIRSFRAAVARERSAGAEISACGNGLFIPSGGTSYGLMERARHIRMTEARIRGLAASLKTERQEYRRLKARLAEQFVMFGLSDELEALEALTSGIVDDIELTESGGL